MNVPPRCEAFAHGGHGCVARADAAATRLDKTSYRGIPVTTVGRTLVDVSGRLTDRQLGKAVDDALRRDILLLEDLRQTAGRLGTAPGRSMRRVHRVLALRIPGYDPLDSDFETRTLRVLTLAGLPVPRQQYPITLDGQVVHLDLAYPEARLAIELDSWTWHGTRSAFDDDRWRDASLVKIHWLSLRLTFRMSDADTIEIVRAALSDRLLTEPPHVGVE